uniref:Uncharacterized protein n=1 Tax=Quercus lobata TaxID=97700 RepID=A0A7N2LHF6_QUELO
MERRIRVLLAVLGSEFFSPCLDRRQRERIGACGGSACLDRRSSRRAWIGDRESGSALVADRRAWIGDLLAVLGSEFFSPCLDRRQREWIESSSRRRAPCSDRRQREWIGVLLGAVLPARIGDRVSGSEFFSAPCSLLGSETERVDRSSSRRRAPCSDRRQSEWIGVLLGAVLPARIGDRVDRKKKL